MNNKKTTLIAGLSLAGVFGLYTAAGIYTVPEGTATIETTGGKISDTAQPGFQHRWLGFQGTHNYHTTKVFEVRLDNLNIYYSPDQIQPKEGEKEEDVAQQYTIHKANVRVTIDPQAVAKLHQKYQSMDAIKRLVYDRTVEAYKAVVRKIDPLKINTQREKIGPDSRDLAQKTIDMEIGQDGVINIDSIAFLDFSFEQGVETAYEEANKERAAVQAEQYKLQQEEIKVDQQRKKGEADAARRIARADGLAQAIEKEGKALKENPEILKLRAIEAWEKGGAQVPETLVVPDNNSSTDFLLPLGVNTEKTPTPPKP